MKAPTKSRMAERGHKEAAAAFVTYEGAAADLNALSHYVTELEAFADALSSATPAGGGLKAWQISELMPNNHRQRTSLENINDVLEALAASPVPMSDTGAQEASVWVSDAQIMGAVRSATLKRLSNWEYSDLINVARAVLALSSPPPQSAPQDAAENDRLRATLERIAGMDPQNIRADDLGRAARMASDAIKDLPSPDSAYWINHDVSSPHFLSSPHQPQSAHQDSSSEGTYKCTCGAYPHTDDCGSPQASQSAPGEAEEQSCSCDLFFSKYRCNAPLECDCPRCQGYCKAHSAQVAGMTDAERMDWLETMTVNVRQPLRYGSRNVFWAGPSDDDGLPVESDLRARIEAALREKAWGKP